jgi:hypothetical protein
MPYTNQEVADKITFFVREIADPGQNNQGWIMDNTGI